MWNNFWNCFFFASVPLRRCWVTMIVWQPCWSTKLLHCVGTPRVVHLYITPHLEATPRSWPAWCRLPWQQTHRTNCWTTNNTPHYTGLRTKVWAADSNSLWILSLYLSSITETVLVFLLRAWRLFGGFTWIQNIYPWRGKPFHPPALCSVSIYSVNSLLFFFFWSASSRNS